MDFIQWLISLFLTKKEPGKIEVAEDPKVNLNKDSDVLLHLASKINLSLEPVKKLIAWRDNHNASSMPRYWAVFDVSKHSKVKRLYVFDVLEQKVTSDYAAHGKNSDPLFTGFATRFSNTSGSLCTSLGIYKVAETYISGKFGYAARLDGLEETNSRARSRAVVFHGAKYVSDAYVKANGKCGRSEGCVAVDFARSKDLIDKLKDGSLLIIWK
jgi:hypothetical protein